jgi:hypothetical protein
MIAMLFCLNLSTALPLWADKKHRSVYQKKENFNTFLIHS